MKYGLESIREKWLNIKAKRVENGLEISKTRKMEDFGFMKAWKEMRAPEDVHIFIIRSKHFFESRIIFTKNTKVFVD